MSKPFPYSKLKTPEYKLTLPITKKDLIYRPYSTADEKVLLAAAAADKDKDPEFYINNTMSVVRDLVLNDINVDLLPSIEVRLFLMHLRAKSVGEVIDFQYEGRDMSINIDEVFVDRYNPENYKIILQDDIGLVMKDISFGDEIRYSIKHKDHPTNAIYERILDSVDKVFDNNDVWVVGDDITRDQVEEMIMNATGISEKLYEFVKNAPVLATKVRNIKGEEITLTSDVVDFLS